MQGFTRGWKLTAALSDRVTEEIVFQAGILALNAALEAPRAGEADIGLGVMADQAHNLARSGAQAAKDTALPIGECIAKSELGPATQEEMAAHSESLLALMNKLWVLSGFSVSPAPVLVPLKTRTKWPPAQSRTAMAARAAFPFDDEEA